MLKMGRTQLQDAVPMTLGQEFEAFARDARRRSAARSSASSSVLLRSQHGRDGDRHGPQRAGRATRRRAPSTWPQITGMPIRLADEPDRSDAGHAGVRPLLRRA